MSKFITRFARDESGATAIEYGLIVALIAVVVITAFTTLGSNLNIMCPWSNRTPLPRGSAPTARHNALPSRSSATSHWRGRVWRCFIALPIARQ